MYAVSQLVDSVSLYGHRILSQVEVDVDNVFIFILWCDPVLHVFEQRLLLEVGRRHLVDVGEELLLQLLGLIWLASEVVQSLDLLTVELLEVEDGRSFRLPPEVGDGPVGEVGEVEFGEGIGECEVDSRLHFDDTHQFRGPNKSVFKNGFLSSR